MTFPVFIAISTLPKQTRFKHYWSIHAQNYHIEKNVKFEKYFVCTWRFSGKSWPFAKFSCNPGPVRYLLQSNCVSSLCESLKKVYSSSTDLKYKFWYCNFFKRWVNYALWWCFHADLGCEVYKIPKHLGSRPRLVILNQQIGQSRIQRWNSDTSV